METYLQDRPSSCIACHRAISNARGGDFVGVFARADPRRDDRGSARPVRALPRRRRATAPGDPAGGRPVTTHLFALAAATISCAAFSAIM